MVCQDKGKGMGCLSLKGNFISRDLIYYQYNKYYQVMSITMYSITIIDVVQDDN